MAVRPFITHAWRRGGGGKGTAENDLGLGSVSRKEIAGPKLIFQTGLSLQWKRNNIKKRRGKVGRQNGLGFTVEEYISIVAEKKV